MAGDGDPVWRGRGAEAARSASDNVVDAHVVWPSARLLLAWALGRCARGAILFFKPGPINFLFNISTFSNYSHRSQLVKYEMLLQELQKISNLSWL
jgi:hypothetical protein